MHGKNKKRGRGNREKREIHVKRQREKGTRLEIKSQLFFFFFRLSILLYFFIQFSHLLQ